MLTQGVYVCVWGGKTPKCNCNISQVISTFPWNTNLMNVVEILTWKSFPALLQASFEYKYFVCATRSLLSGIQTKELLENASPHPLPVDETLEKPRIQPERK